MDKCCVPRSRVLRGRRRPGVPPSLTVDRWYALGAACLALNRKPDLVLG